MRQLIEIVIFSVGAFFVGGIPSAVIIAKISGKQDPREVGSCNVGATNAVRTMGWTVGLLVFLGDWGKGLLIGILSTHFFQEPSIISLAALSVIGGHVFSPFLKFKGGKGVATAFGVFLWLCPLAVFVVFLVWALILIVWRYVSLASIISSMLLPVALWYLAAARPLPMAGLITAAVILIRHRENILRLIRGEEPSLSSPRF